MKKQHLKFESHRRNRRQAIALRLKSIAASSLLVQILVFGSPIFAAVLMSVFSSGSQNDYSPGIEIAVWAFLILSVLAGITTYVRQSLSYRRLIGELQNKSDDLRKEISKRKAMERDLIFRDHQMRIIVDGVQAFVAYVGSDRRYQLVNAAYEHWFGKSTESFIGQKMGGMVAEPNKEEFASKMDEVLSGKEVATEIEIFDKDGIKRTIGASFVPDHDPQGNVIGFVALGFDLTDHKNTENEHRVLAEAAQIFTETLDYKLILQNTANFLAKSMGDVCMIHLKGVNGEMEVVAEAGLTIDEQKRKDALHVAHEVVETRLPLRAETWKQNRISSIAVPLEARGSTFGSLSLLSEKQRFSEHDLELVRELGRRAAFAIDNARLYEEAKTSNRLKDEFLATLSHELRTPLNVICGWSDMIVRGEVEIDEIKDIVKVIQRNALAQTQIVNDLLDMSTIIRGKVNIEAKPVNTAKVLQSAISSVQLAAAAKKITLKVNVEDQSCQILGDFDRIRQVIWNLLSNAVKFTPVNGTVSIDARVRGNQCELVVSDSGQGIESEFLPYIFERFRQEDSTITRKFGGLGLGLAISRQIVELHGGTIQASSRGRGLGTTFTVHLPTASEKDKADEKVKQIAPTSTLSHRPVLNMGLEKPLKGLRILAVDDDPGSRQLIKKILKRGGAEVAAAESAHSALEIFESFHPDIVVSDIGMPDGDGYSLMRSIHEMDPEVPGIALTAFTRDEEKNDAFRAGFRSHIAKPFEPTHLTNELIRIAAQSVTAH